MSITTFVWQVSTCTLRLPLLAEGATMLRLELLSSDPQGRASYDSSTTCMGHILEPWMFTPEQAPLAHAQGFGQNQVTKETDGSRQQLVLACPKISRWVSWIEFIISPLFFIEFQRIFFKYQDILFWRSFPLFLWPVYMSMFCCKEKLYASSNHKGLG